jgi:hypothetical protein
MPTGAENVQSWVQTGRGPLTAKTAPNVSLSFKDPVGHAYQYAAKDSFAYELCAT